MTYFEQGFWAVLGGISALGVFWLIVLVLALCAVALGRIGKWQGEREWQAHIKRMKD